MNDEVKTAAHSQPQPAQQPQQPEQARHPQQPETSLHQRLASLAPPPLLEGEKRTAYDALLKKLADAVKPADCIEEILVRDIIDLVWETLRLRRLKVALMNERSRSPLNPSLALYSAMGRIERGSLSGDELMAVTLDENIDSIERIERLTALAEDRRIAAFREIERHRATRANELRQLVQQVEDAEYEVIEQQPQTTPPEETAAA